MNQTRPSFWSRLFHSLCSGFVLSKTVLFIFGLVLSHALVQKAVVDVLIDFLTEYDLLTLRKAIVLTNLLDLMSAVFKFGLAHISEAYAGPFSVIIFCTAAYTMGLMLLWLDGYSVTSLDLATVLIALGKAGEEPSLRDFFDYQLSEKVREKHSSEGNNRGGTGNNLWSTTASFTGACIAIFWLGKSEIEWSEKFKVSSLVMGSAYLLFFCGILCYYPEARSIAASPLTTIYRVFVAAFQKRRLPYPSSKEGYYSSISDNTHESEERPTTAGSSLIISTISRVFKSAFENRRILPHPSSKESSDNNDVLEDPFYRRENGEVHLLPREASLFLWFLGKAAIIRSNNKSDNNADEEVCSAEQVREVKSLYPLIPLPFIFFSLSLTLASGNTYFVLQTQNMNDKVGGFHVPVMVFFVLQSLVAFVVRTIPPIRRLVKPTWSIAVGMFCSVLCCTAAFLVENRKRNNQMEPLSIMVLTPQYFLLGLMQGFAEYGLEALLCIGVHVSMITFVEPCIQMILAIGSFSNILFVLIFHDWIKDSINDSRLDKYFIMLASLCFVFFGIYVCSVKFKLLKLPQLDEPSETNQRILGRIGNQLEVLVDSINS